MISCTNTGVRIRSHSQLSQLLRYWGPVNKIYERAVGDSFPVEVVNTDGSLSFGGRRESTDPSQTIIENNEIKSVTENFVELELRFPSGSAQNISVQSLQTGIASSCARSLNYYSGNCRNLDTGDYPLDLTSKNGTAKHMTDEGPQISIPRLPMFTIRWKSWAGIDPLIAWA